MKQIKFVDIQQKTIETHTHRHTNKDIKKKKKKFDFINQKKKLINFRLQYFDYYYY